MVALDWRQIMLTSSNYIINLMFILETGLYFKGCLYKQPFLFHKYILHTFIGLFVKTGV